MRTLLTTLVCLTFAGACLGAYIPINALSISPSQPTAADPITVFASGETGAPVTNITAYRDLLGATPGVVELDLFFSYAAPTVICPWSTSVVLNPLPARDYTLVIRTWDRSDMGDERQLAFTVIPEPATALLALLGVAATRRRWR